jgi:two-component system, OmpR family, response regulator
MIHGTLQKCNLADDSKNAIRKPGLKRRPGQEGAASQETYILIVEDSEEIGRLLVRGFQERGFNVVWKTTGQDAMTAASKQPPDVVVLDRMLPDGEGLELLTRWRAQGLTAPVIVLSALTAVEDRVAGLERGADDYLAKPFSFAELLARVRALLRRGVEAALTLQVGELKLDRRTRQVERRGAKIDLTSSQFRLLEFLMEHAGEVVSRKMILDHVWEPGVETATNVIDVYINRLRNKIDKGAERPLIQTVRGLGYVLNDS